MVDDKLNKQENEERTGRKQIRAEKKRERSKSLQKKPTTMLGKRAAQTNLDDVDMEDSGEDENKISKSVRGSLGKQKRNLTPSQRKVSVQKILRDRTASRREGSEPKRLDYKPVPEEHVRLAKKINATWKHKL